MSYRTLFYFTYLSMGLILGLTFMVSTPSLGDLGLFLVFTFGITPLMVRKQLADGDNNDR